MRALLFLVLPALASCAASFYSTNNNTDDDAVASIPDHVTMCDGSAPVGQLRAYLLTQPLHYCMNNGICKRNYLNLAQPCRCPVGFEGPHCEFSIGQVPVCTLQCFSGGTCQAGAKSFELMENSWTSAKDLQYCLCPEGFEGSSCEQQVQVCGDNHCLHGSTCTSITNLQGVTSEYCDCTTAVGGMYAGRYCNHKATTFCAEDDPNGHAFCTNGGTCRGGAALGCDCPDGFIGPVCEFQNQQIAYSECKLECFNGGICRKGAKDISYLSKFGIHRHLVYERFNEDFEHCECPTGFVGLQCEYEMNVCPGREVVCMHGGVCNIATGTTADQPTGMTCDCSSAETDLARYVGDYCEVRSTEFCTMDGQKTSDGASADAFCTQGGRCLAHVATGQPHPGCRCPDGTSGSHCEIGLALAKHNSSSRLLVGLVVGLGGPLVFLLTCLVCRSRRHSYRARRREQRVTLAFKDCPPTLDYIHNSWARSDLRLQAECTSTGDQGKFVNDGEASSLGLSAQTDFLSPALSGNPRPIPGARSSVRSHARFEEKGTGEAVLVKSTTSSSASSVGSSGFNIT